MLTVQHNQGRAGIKKVTAFALIVPMLLATVLSPAVAQAQEPPLPMPAPVDALPGTVPPLPDSSDVEAILETLPPPMFVGPGPMGTDDPNAEALVAEAVALEAAAALENATDAAILAEANAGPFKSQLPLVASEWAPSGLGERIGFGAGSLSIRSFPQVRELGAGWYVDWTARIKPDRPNGMQYMQMVRLHQVIDSKVMFSPGVPCGIGVTADRTICPYAVPHSYIVSPSLDYIKLAAKANPGAVWLIGNEMERVDWAGGGRQDEMLPELYARAYHEVRAVIKAADPSAKIAIGGVIQFTPLRAAYLTKVWNAYAARYGVNMPVDVWNVHNFIGPELCLKDTTAARPERFCYGMAIPVGTTGTYYKDNRGVIHDKGAYVGQDWLVVSKAVFEKQIRDMRQWMKVRNQQNKPLIVTEYGVLWPSLCPAYNYPTEDARAKCKAAYIQAGGWVDLEDPNVVHEFMTWTFDFFLNTKDNNLSGIDDGRLVQQWAWFGLDDIQWGFNPHAVLTDKYTRLLSPAGNIFGQYVRTNKAALQMP